MKLTYGNLFEQEADCIAITTNGFVKKNGEAAMGRGCALQAAKMYPFLPVNLGSAIRANGNNVNRLTMRRDGKIFLLDGDVFAYPRSYDYDIVSFPVKPVLVISNGNNVVGHMASRFPRGVVVPGWAAVADIKIIAKSCAELVALTDSVGWKTVVLPRPGCGAGELFWEQVSPVLEATLDDRFHVIDFSQ
jgi:hypothetical protein